MSADKKRVALWDNLKLFLIFLVFLGHLTICYFSSSQMFETITMVVYTFHMPAFIFVSGLFSKSAINNAKPPLKKAFQFAVLYFMIRILVFISNIIFGVHSYFDILSVKDVPWYMLAMAIWYLVTYAIKGIEPKYIFTVSVIIGCFAGYMKGDTDFLAILRLLTFYPFFYAGYVLDRKKVETAAKKKGAKIFSAVYFIAFTVIITLTIDESSRLFPLLSARRKYYALDDNIEDWGCLLRLAYYAVAALLVFSIISLCPQKELKISKYGGRTLQIYVWHRPILYIIKNAGFLYLIRLVGPGWEWIAIIMVIAVTALLTMKFWAVPINLVMHPKERKWNFQKTR